MLADYLPILMLLGLATLFGVTSLGISARMGPHKPTAAKLAAYESGIETDSIRHDMVFPVKFALVAMLFILFDVEVALLFPWAVIVRELGYFGLAAMGIFAALLGIAFLYDWRSGGLSWEDEDEHPGGLRRELSARMRAELLKRPGGPIPAASGDDEAVNV